MAGGDENEAGHGASEPLGTSPEAKAAEVKPAEGMPGEAAPSKAKPVEPALTPAMSEWIASDARGPLNAVGSLPHASESVPVSEPVPGAPPSSAVPPYGAAPASTPPRKASLWPVAAGIVIGAIIGAGSAYYIDASATDTAGLDQKLAALAGRVDTLDKKPDAEQAVAPVKASLADLATKVAAAEAAAKAATATADAAKKAVQAPQPIVASQTSPGTPPAAVAPAPDLAPLQQKLAALQATLGVLQKQAASADDLKAAQDRLAALDANVAAAQKAVTALQSQAAAAQGDVQTLRTGQKSLEGKITSAPGLAVVSDSLVEQINRGLPFVTQVNALESLGVDPAKIAVLRQSADQGVPSAKTLADTFEPLTDGLLTAERKPAATTGLWDRLKDGAGSLVSVHRVDDVTGDDTASHVARIKADLVHNDVIDAVATWNKLPADARAKPAAAAWGALAKTHAEAIAAARAIERDAIASLGTKKS